MGSGDKKSGGVDPSQEGREEVNDPEIEHLKAHQDRLIAGLARKEAETIRLIVS